MSTTAANRALRAIALGSLVWCVACADPAAAEVVDAGPPLTSIQQISAGAGYTCALLLDGTARCWGENGVGQLGVGIRSGGSATPLAVADLTAASQIATGFGYACARLTDGTARCWGDNQEKAIGSEENAALSFVPSPVAVTGLSTVTEIAPGGGHTCALLADGAVRCWGDNSHGELGIGMTTTTSARTPVDTVGLSEVAQLSAGAGHTCALLMDGTVRCWGGLYERDNPAGFAEVTVMATPTEVPGLAGVAQISAGFGGLDSFVAVSHTCALLTDGTARCWGVNQDGQLGDGTTVGSAAPVVVEGLAGVAQIAAGYDHTCALLTDGTARCWGGNQAGQLGDGTTIMRTTPVAVMGLSGATQITAGETHTCAVLVDGTARCWGAGPLGNNVTSFSTTPVLVTE